MKLSILTPTIPGREAKLQLLQDKIQLQAAAHPGQVEHLVFCDNRTRSIGAKRQALLDISRGEYFAFVDDDDDITADYISSILKASISGADVITFLQAATYNDQISTVEFRLRQGDHAFLNGGVTKRDAWHVCAWRRSRVIGCEFGETNYGEDLIWSKQARLRAETTIHIPRVLHVYQHSAETTAAPEPIDTRA